MDQYRKAIAAAVVGVLTVVAGWAQAALAVTSEAQLVATSAVGFVVATLAVWRAKNAPPVA